MKILGVELSLDCEWNVYVGKVMLHMGHGGRERPSRASCAMTFPVRRNWKVCVPLRWFIEVETILGTLYKLRLLRP